MLVGAGRRCVHVQTNINIHKDFEAQTAFFWGELGS